MRANDRITIHCSREILWEGNDMNGNPLIYSEEEKKSWEVIILLPGVKVIPGYTFYDCRNAETLIISDSIKRIEGYAFTQCVSLVFVKLSTNLEYIGECAFCQCFSLTSIFIPPPCREIGLFAFWCCYELIIFIVPRHTQLGNKVIGNTAFNMALNNVYQPDDNEDIDDWIRTRHIYNPQINDWIRIHQNGNQFALHRICSSSSPSIEEIDEIVKQHGLAALKKPDSIGITPSKYLAENPFAEI